MHRGLRRIFADYEDWLRRDRDRDRDLETGD
jgi:hypothetical protein